MSAITDSAHQRTEQSPTTISRIAVGVDGYPESSDAIVLGATIARAVVAELVLVTVYPEPLVILPEEMNRKSLERHATAMLREARDSLAPHARLAVEADLSAPRALERVVRRERLDLLVVGSSRHGSEGHVRIGKRTRELLCHFNCALAIAPRGMHRRHAPQLKRIGVGHDGSPESDAAVALAGAIATAAGADLHITAVVDDRIPPIGWSTLAIGGAAMPVWEEAVVDEMRRRQEAVLTALAGTGGNGEAGVLRGRPADALLKLSEEVDLLVIGSRRWGPVARLLLGSTGEALAHDASCSLLVVPRPSGKTVRT
jgi:nucleotide-binding universal stress UspA family protein